MDLKLYQQYLRDYVIQAVRSSNGTTRSIAEELDNIQVKGLLVRHREEKTRALAEARKAFAEHRHWPLDIVLSHLGVEVPGLKKA